MAWFGWSVATAGDVNGDSYSAVIVGAILYTNGESEEDRAFPFYGNEGDGLNHIARQGQSDGTAPIQVLGRSASESSFGLNALGRTPLVRGDVRLQGQAHPFVTTAELAYALPQRGRARLAIYDVAGREVASLVDATQEAGRHIVHWKGRSAEEDKLPAGVYFARLEFSGRVDSHKIVLAH